MRVRAEARVSVDREERSLGTWCANNLLLFSIVVFCLGGRGGLGRSCGGAVITGRRASAVGISDGGGGARSARGWDEMSRDAREG